MAERSTVEGAVQSLIFQNEDNGYTVLSLLTDDGELVTVVGCIPCAAPGEGMTGTGVWTNHPSYGPQFAAESVERRMPETEEDIAAYLASGILKGIGPATAQRLVDHHPRMGQRRALALGAGSQEHGSHRGRQPGADGRHVGIDQLHRVINAQSGRNRPAGRVDVDLNVLLGIDRFEEQQLGLDDIGRVVVDRRAEEDDAVHHQARENVHRGDVQLTLLDDRRRHVGRAYRLEIVQFQRTDPAVVPCVFFKF